MSTVTNGKASPLDIAIAATPATTAPKNGPAASAKDAKKKAGKKPTGKDKPSAVEVVGALQTLRVPLPFMIAGLACVAKDASRNWLHGLYFHRTKEGFYRMAATDGNRLLIVNLVHEDRIDKADRPAWLNDGLLVPADQLKARLSIIQKAAPPKEAVDAVIAYGEAAAKMELRDVSGEIVFKTRPVDGEFPSYQSVVDHLDAAFMPDREVFESTAFKPAYLKAAGEMAKVLGAEHLSIYTPKQGTKQAAVILFGNVPGVVLILMPEAHDGHIDVGSRLILSAPITRHVAALKAHRTRLATEMKNTTDKTAQGRLAEQVEAYTKRIAAVIANVGDGTPAALPAPDKPKKNGAAEPEAAPPAPPTPTPPTPTVPAPKTAPARAASKKVVSAVGRAKTKSAKAKRA